MSNLSSRAAVPDQSASSVEGTRNAWSLSRRRLLASLTLGAIVIGLVYKGPPVDEIAGVHLWFGLRGPISGDPWKWIGVGLLLAIVFGVERLGLASLPIRRPRWAGIEWALYLFGGAMAWAWLADMIAPQVGNAGIEVVLRLGVLGILVLTVTAAVTEEIVYRGFLAERLGALFGARSWAPWAGAGLSLAIFVAPHLTFFGPSWLLHQFPTALAIAVIAVVRRNLVIAMLVHLLTNLPILYLLF